MIRAVIDTNVLVSGLLSRSGNEALILLAVNQGLIRPCLSPAIIEEYRGVLGRRKFGFAAREIASLISMLQRKGEICESPAALHRSPDPDDSKFLDCAAATAADFIITGNKRHFPHSPSGGTRVVNAGELLELITREI